MAPPRVPKWLYACVLVSALLSCYSMSKRFEVEQHNKATELAAEIDSVASLSAAEGKTLQEGLEQLKSSGINAVVIPEEYVGELVGVGEIQIQSGRFVSGTPAALQRVMQGVKIRFPGYASHSSFVGTGAADGATAIQLPDVSMIRGVAVGLNPNMTAAAKAAGMMIIARCSNPPSATSEAVGQTLEWAHSLGATIFLPQGDQVLGRKQALGAFEDSLQKLNMRYAAPEFAKIGGDENVVKDIPGYTLRLHAAQSQELDRMPDVEAVDRYARAARERNQRILLLRPLSPAADQPLTAFATYVSDVKSELEKQGGIVGQAAPFDDSGVPVWLYVLIGLSVAPVAFWTTSALLPRKTFVYAAGLLFLLMAVATVKPAGRPIEALLAALVFPTAAFLVLDGRNGRSWLIEYIVISLISLTGGLCEAGLLNAQAYFVHAEQFEGVKFAHFAPIAVVGAYFYWRFLSVRESLRSPMLWGKALLALVVLGGLGLMFARTGNDNPAAVSGMELKLRAILDAILFVRPRTKEFLIGHPLLIVGIGILISIKMGEPRFQNWKGWTALLLMCGAIGQTSIVNTMCHIHTPLTISLARIGVGLVAGGIIGAVLWALTKRFAPRTEV